MLLFAVKTDWSSLVWFVCLSGLFCLSLISRLYNSHDSDDDFRSGCQNVGQCHQQQSFSGLLSPGQANHTKERSNVNKLKRKKESII